jgi:hypothetical protein
MASLSDIPLPTPPKTTASNLAAEWKRVKGQWQNYVKAAKVDKEELGCQAAIFLACIGADAYICHLRSLADLYRGLMGGCIPHQTKKNFLQLKCKNVVLA